MTMYRILLHEYGDPKSITELAASCGTTPQNFCSQLDRASARIAKALSLSSSPFIMDSDTVRAVNVAGTIRLSAQVELEVVPKYLGFSEDDIHWKEDFYLLSILSRHGNLLEGDNIHTSTAFKSSLYDIAGRALAEGFQPLRRQLLRKYRRNRFEDYSIEGEIRFEDSFVRQLNGMPQENVAFDKNNEYNATILAAMKYVRPHINDPGVQRILGDSITVLSPQNDVRLDRPRLTMPGRDIRWKREYDLAYDIIHGMGAVFSDGSILSPGFMVSTWRIWEWLLTSAVRVGEPTLTVVGQKPFPFGLVTNRAVLEQPLHVYPDISALQPDTGEALYLVDAKYKRLSLYNNREADRSDIFEALAFCRASRCNTLFLAYPCEVKPDEGVGIRLVETYLIDGNAIYIIQVPVQRLAVPGGLRNFSFMVTGGIHDILTPPGEAQAG